MKKTVILLIFAFCLSFAACAGSENSGNKTEGDAEVTTGALLQEKMPEAGDQIAVITTSMGVVKVRFFEKQAPKAVENFITLAKQGYYDGTIFHRVFEEFMIQGGDPTGTGYGGESCWGKAFEDEFSDELFNFRGALSMANSGSNTNGSQFFIVQNSGLTASTKEACTVRYGITEEVLALYDDMGGGTPWLDGVHTVFGQVFEGMDVVDAISGVEATEAGKPLTDVTIESVVIAEYEG